MTAIHSALSEPGTAPGSAPPFNVALPEGERETSRAKPSILVTGGAGFIGSNFVLHWIGSGRGRVVTLDKLTYAGNLDNLASLSGNPDHAFVQGDIRDGALVRDLLEAHRPHAIVHLAAETHVDRSILSPEPFIGTNVQGTFSMLSAAFAYFETLRGTERDAFRFLHGSTDEVYGSLGPDDPPFHEKTPFAPNSPYAASKAASDHLVRAWGHTYGLPALTTHCSNNYGPRQTADKLLPLTIANALAGRPLPVYGDGRQVRDWLHVADHCRALALVLDRGTVGETYIVGGGGENERTNLSVVHSVCDLLDELLPGSAHPPHRRLIRFVEDRPGHDRRYAVDTTKIRTQLGWKPEENFGEGLRKTVAWYVERSQQDNP